ncbi:hypothetical protein [Nocardioides jishulii]|uniref:Uncharacterized protein n=1 Tax=Nocardioides jishulii TaxID=2575440 RepID=A0A4U2YIY8_9ACTN|nr:hypothetical protein [Nocardioides jishulii]QCX26728.1 hypothetical protein FCL41_03600 [Nocardioides jishulii]TKI60302.1 hypothetical protein FC770_15950 [Nocardioides jishulii]
MIDHDQLTARLHDLGQRAPLPAADPDLDLRRGRAARRRRLARRVAGTATAFVVVGVAATQLPVFEVSGEPGGSALAPASEPSATQRQTPTPAPMTCGDLAAMARQTPAQPTQTPAQKAALAAYRQAAAAILDPSGQHFDHAEIRQGNGIQSKTWCDPVTDEYRAMALGTKIGWREGGALGVVQIEVVSPQDEEGPQALFLHDGWTAYDGELPEGAARARVTSFSESGGGHAVVVDRIDGLVVAVEASGVFGNNAAPGAAAVTRLPAVERLLTLAASSRLTLPQG